MTPVFLPRNAGTILEMSRHSAARSVTRDRKSASHRLSRSRTVCSSMIVTYFGMRYIVPVMVGSPGVILAVNVGGAVIPTLLSIYLLTKNRLWERGLIAIACVATICHAFAQPVHGVGIALPIFVPPLVAAVTAAVVSWRNAAPLAYAGGSLGVLIGADLLNLGKLQGLGAPVVSIGGAGTFDGIFVTGLMAVLLAGLTGRRTAR